MWVGQCNHWGTFERNMEVTGREGDVRTEAEVREREVQVLHCWL